MTEDSPVYLTRNGRGEYAIIKINELDKLKSTIRLLAKLEEGEKSVREKGWLSADEVWVVRILNEQQDYMIQLFGINSVANDEYWKDYE